MSSCFSFVINILSDIIEIANLKDIVEMIYLLICLPTIQI